MTCIAALYLPPSGDYARTDVLYTAEGNGPPADLTGYTASIVDVTGSLAGAVAASIPDAAAGKVRIAVTWQGAWPVTPSLLGTFRVSFVKGAEENVSDPIPVWVQGPALTILAARGCDLTGSFLWPDDRDGAGLAGETLDVITASATLAGLVSVAVTDAATRACSWAIEGDLATPLGAAGTFQFRRLIAGAQPRTLPPISVTFT